MAIEDEVLNEQQQQQAEDDESAGFNASFGVEPPAEEAADEDQDLANADTSAAIDDVEAAPADEEDQDPADDAGEDPEEVDEEAERERLATLLDGLPTLQERSQMTEQQIRQLNGKIGEINRIVKGLQDRPAATVTKESFKRTLAEFPEIAETLAEDLAGLSIGGQSVDVDPIVQERVQAATQKIERSMELKLLGMVHKDWKQVTASDGFKKWVTTLPEDQQTELANSWDSSYIADKLTEYKEFSKAQQQQATKRNQRLAGALLPKTRTVPTRTLATEEDGFNAAFR
jgi:hypothetical protein